MRPGQRAGGGTGAERPGEWDRRVGPGQRIDEWDRKTKRTWVGTGDGGGTATQGQKSALFLHYFALGSFVR